MVPRSDARVQGFVSIPVRAALGQRMNSHFAYDLTRRSRHQAVPCGRECVYGTEREHIGRLLPFPVELLGPLVAGVAAAVVLDQFFGQLINWVIDATAIPPSRVTTTQVTVGIWVVFLAVGALVGWATSYRRLTRTPTGIRLRTWRTRKDVPWSDVSHLSARHRQVKTRSWLPVEHMVEAEIVLRSYSGAAPRMRLHGLVATSVGSSFSYTRARSIANFETLNGWCRNAGVQADIRYRAGWLCAIERYDADAITRDFANPTHARFAMDDLSHALE